jgi:hypothetical protein
VADRRLLLVLDNAADAAQVRPLLPASPLCGVLATSRRALVSLEGAAQLQLDVLEPSEALDLLGRLAGKGRVAAEHQAAAEVARLCGYLAAGATDRRGEIGCPADLVGQGAD